MPEPIATAAVAFIEFTMVRHWLFSLTSILAFTLWASFLAILAIVFLATLYFTYRVFTFSPVVPIATAAVIVLVYAGWLWRITRRIVAEEFGDEVTISHAVTALIPAQIGTWILFVVSLGAIQSAFVWICSQIPA